MDFSKNEAGQLDIEMINCSLGKLLNSLEFMTRTHAEEKSIDFKIVAHNDLPAQIKSDPCRLQQCLLNLLNNAVKFTDQGHVHLKVSLHEDNGTHSIRFDIEDTGIGIPKHRQSAIFESFTQADGSTTRKYGGTGLGLTITRQLSELLGGELTVITEPGKGSVFSLIIPTGVDITGQPLLNRDDALAQGADESRQADTTRFSGKVLVAEDVEGNQKLMMLMLSKWGVEVAIAQDGNQALQKALSQSFDLILMDMQMPNMNGYEATCILKQRGYKTPIVALTANAMKGDDQTCIDAGCDDYLAKPIDRRELARILAKYLPGNQEDAAKAIDPIPALARESERLGSKQSSCPADTPNEVEISDTVNWDHLIDVMGDKETIQEIMPTYAKDMQEHLDKLFHAVESENCESIASHAHALKGVGRNLGSGQLTEIAGQMECSGKKNDVEKSTLLINDLKIEIEKVLTVVSQYG
ncbi:MAG: response regulator [Phycisphaeraceae bacterium]|nr:response regulator [Phycisphaeraceae bacterium]